MAKNNETATVAADENKPVVLSTETESTTLSLKFECESGDSRTISFKYVRSDLSDGDVTAAMGSMIEAGDAWEDALIEIISAEQTVTNKIKYNVA